MKVPSLRPDAAALVNELAAFEGVGGCSVAEAETGMTCYHPLRLPDVESTGEAAAEFWQIQGCLSSLLAVLDSLQSVAYAVLNRIFVRFSAAQTVL